ncbi:unnamed protein product [Coffea canephora]|uniref:C2 NT-type domain-containing protein n=1 Tax=Coffea canephora TaxID=49390 RepID=A0A068U9R7_COFCA|nr:unnamed protein product [Coffea canephora]
MFKSATWRSERKIKAVFKMQFQATQVPRLKAKTLAISLVPADVGRPTVRLGKSSIREGTCSWESPVYETVKLVKETKTGKFRGKIYHFIVSAGSSKAGLLGEASIDFVDFLEATYPVMVSLPIEATNSGAILHVTIQKLERTLDERYIEENESPTTNYHNGILEMQLLDSENSQKTNLEFTEGEQPNRITSQYPEQNGSVEDTRFDDASAYRVCLTTADNTLERVSLDADPPGHVYQRYSDGLLKDTSDESVIDTTTSLQEKYARDRIQEASNDVGRLNTRIKMLERQGEVSELELQSLRRQMAKESRKVKELSEQIVALKSERDILKKECEQLKSSPKGIDQEEISNNSGTETKNVSEISEQIKQQLHREKHLSKKLRSQLQKTEDSNSELILAVRDLKEVLSRKDKEIAHLAGQIQANQNEVTLELEETHEEHNKADEVELLKQERANLFAEMEISRKEKEELKKCIQQFTLDNENLKKEKAAVYSDLEQKQGAMMEIQHEYLLSTRTVKQLKEETKNQAILYSEYLTIIDELKTKVQSLEEELEKEAKYFQDNLTAEGRAMVEQEQRAIQAEEALTKANWSNTKETEHLREELKRKSEELISKIDENEKLTAQAVAEGNQLRMHSKFLEKLLQKANDEIQLSKNEYERKLLDLSKGIHLEAQSMGMVSQRKSAHSQARYEIGTMINDKEQRKREYGDSKMLQKWTEQKEELERELLLVKMEAEKLIEENITLRNLIDEKSKRDEILHPEVEKLVIQYDKSKCSSQEMKLENRDLKKHVSKLQVDPNKKKGTADLDVQETKPVKDVVMCDKTPEEGMHSLGMLKSNESEIAKSQRDQITSQRELNLGNHHANHIADLAEFSSEVTFLKELNTHMALELKEMQERYSEMSLKFAEVEGERQQLVMTLRNLKNGKKT